MTDMTKSDVHDSCEQCDTCVNNPSVDDNEPYATHIYFGWALSRPVAGSSGQVHVHCNQTGVKQHSEVSPHIESTIADSLALSPREGENLTRQDNPCRVTWGKAPRFVDDLTLTYLFASTSEKCYLYVTNDMLRIYLQNITCAVATCQQKIDF